MRWDAAAVFVVDAVEDRNTLLVKTLVVTVAAWHGKQSGSLITVDIHLNHSGPAPEEVVAAVVDENVVFQHPHPALLSIACQQTALTE